MSQLLLKLTFFSIKQNHITKHLKRLHLRHNWILWCSFGGMASLVSRLCLIIQSFVILQLCETINHKPSINRFRRFFLRKVNKNIQQKTRYEKLCTFLEWRHWSPIQNFVPSWKMIKTPQNLVGGSFSIKQTKYRKK